MPIRGENKGISRGTGSRAVSRPPRERGQRAVDVVEVDASSGESSESTNSDALDDDDNDVDGALERLFRCDFTLGSHDCSRHIYASLTEEDSL